MNDAVQAPADPLIIARITGVYGVKGWVKVHSYTEPQTNFLQYRDCFLGREGRWQACEIREGRVHGKGLVAQLAGVDDRDQAQALTGMEIAVPTASLPALDSGDYYWFQLQGLRVFSADHQQLLGQVDHLLATGANDVLVVKRCDGSIDARERLIPYVPDLYIKEVNLAEGWIRVDWDPEF